MNLLKGFILQRMRMFLNLNQVYFERLTGYFTFFGLVVYHEKTHYLFLALGSGASSGGAVV
jgi:hypothetical protein